MTLHEFPRLGERYWEQRLENGLLLRVVPKPGFARSYAFLGVDYGSIDTSFTRGAIPCRTPDGVAHYLEHKMFDLPEDNAMNLFAAHGGYPNAFTGYAMTAYYFDCTEQFAENLRILLRMVLTPWFPAESVEKERGIIAQEIRMYEDYHVVALMGDGAMTGGLAYEAMNDAGESSEQLIVILNDNGMSITPNVGGIAQHLALIRTRPGYYRIKKAYRAVTAKVPGGKCLYRLTHRLKEHWKRMLFGTTFFEEMGFEYYGPVDGHDLKRLEYMLRLVKDRRHPVLLHVITQKGKGYAPAEENPDVFHGIGHFDSEKGMEPRCGHLPTFSDTFSETIDALGAQEPRICAITAAMLRGTGLDAFAAHYPERCFDVGIAEGHAVSMAGGLAKQGMIPVVAIYSTFLQRAYDMLLQDVAMLGLHVVFAVDRAGLVGGDGETHHGVFDVNYLRSVPGMQVLCPASQAELGQMLRRAVLEMTGPVAVRYPRGCDGTFTGIAEQPCLREGSDITLVTYGTLINEVLAAAKLLEARGISAEVLKLPSIKPLDVRTVAASMRKTGRLLVAEESVCIGCAGKELLASLRARGVGGPVRLCNLGDRFIPHGAVPELYRMAGLDARSLADAAWEVCQNEA